VVRPPSGTGRRRDTRAYRCRRPLPISELPGGAFTVTVRTLDARASKATSVEPGKTATCDLALEYLNGILGGWVLARPSGLPIANALVASGDGPTAMTDEQGRFELEGLDEDAPVDLVASAPGSARGPGRTSSRGSGRWSSSYPRPSSSTGARSPTTEGRSPR